MGDKTEKIKEVLGNLKDKIRFECSGERLEG